MIPISFIVVLCGLAAFDAVGAYYQPIVSYGVAAPAAAGYLLPAYVPPYAAYHVAAPAAGAYYNGQQDKKQQQSYDQDTKYYYGGKFQGTCSNDGLYYKDDTTFVICSNGYASEQPCPPGTKTGGYPNYQAGYYYGYTDLCSVNLVDYGYGPSSYASSSSSSGYGEGKEASQASYKDKSYGNSYDDKKSYGKESYTTSGSSTYAAASSGDNYQASKPTYGSASNSYQAAPPSYASKNTYSSASRDAAGYEIKESYPSYPSANSYQSTASSYSTKNNYQPAAGASYASRDSYSPSSSAGSNPYVAKDSAYPAARDSAYPSGDAYASKNAYQSKDTSYQNSYQSKAPASYQSKDTAYPSRDDYSSKVTYPAKPAAGYVPSDKRY